MSEEIKRKILLEILLSEGAKNVFFKDDEDKENPIYRVYGLACEYEGKIGQRIKITFLQREMFPSGRKNQSNLALHLYDYEATKEDIRYYEDLKAREDNANACSMCCEL